MSTAATYKHAPHPNRPPTSHTSRYSIPDVVDSFRYLKPRQITRRTSRHLWALGRPPACRGGPRPLRSLVAVRRPGQGIFRHFSGLVSFGRAASVASPRELLSGQASGSSLRGRLPRDHSSLESRDTRACHRHEGTSFCPFLAPQRRTMGFTESPSGLSHFPRDSCQISWLGTG